MRIELLQQQPNQLAPSFPPLSSKSKAAVHPSLVNQVDVETRQPFWSRLVIRHRRRPLGRLGKRRYRAVPGRGEGGVIAERCDPRKFSGGGLPRLP
jgi:hypothetical protein